MKIDAVVADSAASWDGSPLPAYPAGRPCVSILRFTVQPHARLTMHSLPLSMRDSYCVAN